MESDRELEKYFGKTEIITMAEEVADHRSSMFNKTGRHPRNTYGKIISTADRRSDFDQQLKDNFAFVEKFNQSIERTLVRTFADNQRRYGLFEGLNKDIRYFDDPNFIKDKAYAIPYLSDINAFIEKFCAVNGIESYDPRLLQQEIAENEIYIANERKKAAENGTWR